MKKFQGVVKDSKTGSQQLISVLAEDRADAEKQIMASQYRREARFPLTYERIRASGMSKEQMKAELERRKMDEDRYSRQGMFKIVSLKEAD